MKKPRKGTAGFSISRRVCETPQRSLPLESAPLKEQKLRAEAGRCRGVTYLNLKDFESAKNAFEKAEEEFENVLRIDPPNNYAARMSAFNMHRLGRGYAALAGQSKRSNWAAPALENMQAGFDRLLQMRNAGKLGDVDNKEIADIEKEIEEFKSRQNVQ